MFIFGNKQCDLNTPRVMGVLNMTPDSFFDGGSYFSGGKPAIDLALKQAALMVKEGADFIDVGGESTRPGAVAVSEQEEMNRVLPVVEAIVRRLDVVVSVDTSSAAVISEVAKLGAGLINDVRALQRPGAIESVVASDLPVSLMHMQGEPPTMQAQPSYLSVVDEVVGFLRHRIACCVDKGMDKTKIIVDPGFGFGKTLEHNLQLMAALEKLNDLGCPLLIGVSRKSMLQHITGRSVEQRLAGSLALATIAAIKGAKIFRVHDVKETVDVLKTYAAVYSNVG